MIDPVENDITVNVQIFCYFFYRISMFKVVIHGEPLHFHENTISQYINSIEYF